jgi:nucleotide-binding universal stress UspA family protein
MKLILVALDGSPNARKVLAGARELAEKVGARLILFHAVSLPVGLPLQAYAVSPSDVGPLMLQAARREFEDYARDLPPGLVAEVRIELGIPWQAICEEAKAQQVDLIAVGSHGYTGLDRLLGTTAAKVVNHADRSVLVVRAVELLDELLGT